MKNAINAATNAVAIAIAVLSAPFKSQPSIENIVGKVEKNIDELMVAAEFHADRAAEAEAASQQKRREANLHWEQCAQAERIASRLDALIS